MTDREKEIERIVEWRKDTPYLEYDYEGLPPAENSISLVKYPEQTTLTEKIGNTEYTVNARFKEDGRDLLSLLAQLIEKGVCPNVFYEE